MAGDPSRQSRPDKSKGKKGNSPAKGRRGGFAGGYGSESYDLSKKTLRAAGAAKAAKKRTVSISDTRREGSKTLGPGGKPLNGTVVMQNGSKAVYKDGRRVQAADARKPKTASRPSGGGGGGGSTGGGGGSASTARKPPRQGEIRKGAAGRNFNQWNGTRWVRVPNPYNKKPGGTTTGPKAAPRGATAAAAAERDGSRYSTGSSQPGPWPKGSPKPGTSPSSSGPKKGDRRPVGGYGGYEVYDGSKWVRQGK
jgi:hypothetical protein